MSNISVRQNSDESIMMLAAQRQLYTDGKALTIWLFIVSIALPFVIVIMKPFFKSNPKVYFVLSLISTLLLIPAYWLKSLIQNKKNMAAVIQNRFDYELFGFSWDELKMGDLSEIQGWIHKGFNKYRKKHTSLENLKDWYPVEYSSMKIEEGRIHCQKCNVYWDGDLKKQYRLIITFISAIIVLTALALTVLFSNSTVASFCMKVFLPLIPVYFYLYTINTAISKDIARIDKIKLLITNALNMLNENTYSNDALSKQSLLIQSLIFEHRKNSVLVLDVIYNRIKERQESVAKANAAKAIEKQ